MKVNINYPEVRKYVYPIGKCSDSISAVILKFIIKFTNFFVLLSLSQMQLIPRPAQHSESKYKKLNLTFNFIQNSILTGAGTVQLVKKVGYGLNNGGIRVRFQAGP
jgi:hypothetical protein